MPRIEFEADTEEELMALAWRCRAIAAELAGELFHHHGKSAGQPLSERTARRIVHDLEATGWVSVPFMAASVTASGTPC